MKKNKPRSQFANSIITEEDTSMHNRNNSPQFENQASDVCKP